MSGTAQLPRFDAAPVTEVVAAVQFRPLPRLTFHDMIEVAQRLDSYELTELQPQLPPIQESPPGTPPVPPFPQMWLGQHPQRALYQGAEERFIAQLQLDRIAINERRLASGSAPSYQNVWPELDRFAQTVDRQLAGGDAVGPKSPNVVELTYVNVIPGESADRVLRIVSPVAGEPPYTTAENPFIRFTFPVMEADAFRGRLHVEAGTAFHGGSMVIQLQLVSRRLADPGASLKEVFDACHHEAVRGFMAFTEPEMHTLWRRTR